jgi:hypothetical protein
MQSSRHWLGCACALALTACGTSGSVDDRDGTASAGALTDGADTAGGAGAADAPDAAGGPEGVNGGDAAGPRWKPMPGTTWQWQLQGEVDTTLDVMAYDVDLVDTPQATIDRLHTTGKKVICYFSAGSYEDWRSDASRIPSAARGRTMDGWPNERWLDVRSAGVRAVMTARMDVAVTKRCDAVEPDNVDGYANDTGFALSAADQLDFNRFIAAEAHARGLSVALKNDLDQIGQLVGAFDFAVNEQCFEYDECDGLDAFVDANKAVLQVEYGGASLARSVCPKANARNFDTQIKELDLGPWRVACR